MDLVAAQAFVFFIAGFETSSTTMAYALYEVARQTDIQDRVRAEIDEVLKKHDGEITYESLMEMSYLHKVVSGKLLFVILKKTTSSLHSLYRSPNIVRGN